MPSLSNSPLIRSVPHSLFSRDMILARAHQDQHGREQEPEEFEHTLRIADLARLRFCRLTGWPEPSYDTVHQIIRQLPAGWSRWRTKGRRCTPTDSISSIGARR